MFGIGKGFTKQQLKELEADRKEAEAKKYEEWKAAQTLYQNPNFRVTLDYFLDPAVDRFIDGYGVYNLQTNIREAETRRLVTAIALADMFHKATVAMQTPDMESDEQGGAVTPPPFNMPQTATLM